MGLIGCTFLGGPIYPTAIDEYSVLSWSAFYLLLDDVMKWKHYPRYWPFVQGIHRSTVIFPDKGQWRGALMFTLICTRINGWVNNREAGDLRRHRTHYDVIVMNLYLMKPCWRHDTEKTFRIACPLQRVLILLMLYSCYHEQTDEHTFKLPVIFRRHDTNYHLLLLI